MRHYRGHLRDVCSRVSARVEHGREDRGVHSLLGIKMEVWIGVRTLSRHAGLGLATDALPGPPQSY
eukprot:6323214-Pyramimonas_sp.AAC.1